MLKTKGGGGGGWRREGKSDARLGEGKERTKGKERCVWVGWWYWVWGGRGEMGGW